MREDLLEACGRSEALAKLGVTVTVTMRAKSAFSTMKKLLQLSGLARDFAISFFATSFCSL
jgi:hypothetical protein